MTKQISEIIQELESRAPSSTAEDWDNVGLLAGDPKWRTPGAVVSVDLTAQSIEVARKRGYRLIVTHHPAIFPRGRGLNRLVAGEPGQDLLFQALRLRIAVAAYHTNFDQCSLEVVRTVSNGLKVKPLGRLIEAGRGPLTKLAVFVPESHLQKVRSALGQAGAGHIGNYDSCTFSSPGEGTFRGREGATPFLGKPGRLETAREFRLETVFPSGLSSEILRALRESHPYEEIAYDLYALEQPASNQGLTRGLGYGFWGEFDAPRLFSDLAKDVRSLFNIDGFWLTGRLAGNRRGRIRRLGFVAGKGASFIQAAASAGCDLLITGEAGYHAALDADRRGVSVMELGHRESERFYLTTVEGWIRGLGLRTVSLNLPTQRIVNFAEFSKATSESTRR